MNSFPLIDPDKVRVGHYVLLRVSGHPDTWVRVVDIDSDDDFTGEDAHGGITCFRREDIADARVGLVPEDYRRAIRAQGASNPLALVSALGELVPLLLTDCYFKDRGRDWASDHPIFQLYLHQIAYLTTGGGTLSQSDFEAAYNACDRIAISDTLSVNQPTPTA